MRGVTVFEIRNGRIVSGRLYMEEVEEGGAAIDETVRRLAEGTQSERGDVLTPRLPARRHVCPNAPRSGAGRG